MLRKWAVFSLMAMAAVQVSGQSNSADAEDNNTSSSVTSTASDTKSTTSASKSETASSPDETETADAPAKTHTVKVGYPLGQHAFDPEEVYAKVGDTIEFEMWPANHSVAQMDPEAPCIPWSEMHPNSNLKTFYTGFHPVETVADNTIAPISYHVEDDKPVWFYCSAPGSCPDFQMVMVVNPEKNETDLMDVKVQAGKAQYSLSPGEKVPDDSNLPATDTEDDSSTETPAPSSDGGSGLSGGAIAGIVIGAVAAFALVGLLFFLVGRKKKAAEIQEKPDGAVAGYPPNSADTEHTAATEHPPMYDPRYSQQVPPPPASPRPWSEANAKHGHVSMMSEDFNERNPNRMSELPSQNYDPVEIYTPGLPEHHDIPSPIQEEAGSPRDTRRDTIG